MKLTLNKEYAHRHLFVTLLMLGLGLWFGYDGFVRYPDTPAIELYRSIEKSDPPAGMDLEAFKDQKTKTQYGFTFACLLAALIIGVRLNRARKFSFEWDDAGFTVNGVHHTKDEIEAIDDSLWEKKSILTLRLKNGSRILLDAWHHLGVKDFLSPTS